MDAVPEDSCQLFGARKNSSMALEDDESVSKLYEPCSLSECADMILRPLGRDHYLCRNEEQFNQLTISDVILGVGTEQKTDTKKRIDISISHLGRFIDEVTVRNVNRIGLPLVKTLLNIETDADEDGVPLEDVENELCSVVGRILVRCDQVSSDSQSVRRFCSALLSDGEQLVYHKYKLLKSLKAGFKQLSYPSESDGRGLLAIVGMDKQFSMVKLQNRFTETYSKTLQDAFSRLISASKLAEKALLPEIAAAQVSVAGVSKDWGSLESSIDALIYELDRSKPFRTDIMETLVSFLLAHESVLPMYVYEDDRRKILYRVLRRSSESEMKEELREVIMHFVTLLEEFDPRIRISR